MLGSRTKSSTRTNSAFIFSKQQQQQQQADSAAESAFTKAAALSWQDGFTAGVNWNITQNFVTGLHQKKRESKASQKAAQKKCSSATVSE